MSEILHAVLDDNNVVVNIIVVGPTWDQPTIPLEDYVVGIGCVYNQEDKKFYLEDRITPVKTHTELQAEYDAQQDVLLSQ